MEPKDTNTTTQNEEITNLFNELADFINAKDLHTNVIFSALVAMVLEIMTGANRDPTKCKNELIRYLNDHIPG